MNKMIFFNKPAESFTDGFPIGNGRLAAMVLSDYSDFKLTLNHEWLWSTDWKDRVARNSAEHLSEVRNVLLSGDCKRGTELSNQYFSGVKDNKARICSYLPAGNLNVNINTDEISDYVRKLDLAQGFTETTFIDSRCGRVDEIAFISLENSIGVVHIECENESKITIALSREEDPNATIRCTAENDLLVLEGVLPVEYEYKVYCRIISNGTIGTDGKKAILNATDVTLFFDIQTEKDDDSVKDNLLHITDSYETLLSLHRSRFSKALGESEIDIKGKTFDGNTADRLERFKSGADHTIPVLFWQYAKYLMITGSSAELPLNLQGKWNADINPMWHCDYHFDINLQMNYWIAPILGLKEQEMPLFNYIESCSESAALTAKNLYGCRGVCFALCSDAWGRTTPESYGWDVWVGAAPWFAADFYRYFEYTGDPEFLRDRAYPFMKKAAQFIEDYLVYDGDKAIIVPSSSPENHFEESGDFPISMCKNSVMDITLFREALTNAANAADILNTDKTEAEKWRSIVAKLPEISIGKSGRLLEWGDEYTEWEKGHRHFSNLYGLYPGNEIKAGSNLAKAALNSLECRLKHGAGKSGWSRGWAVCLYARLKDGKNAWKHLKNLICDHISTSLLDLHPACFGGLEPIFQIDGNFGGAAGICEMLNYSETGEIELLPALPEEWKTGSFKGFKAKGNITVDAEWENGAIKKIKLLTPVNQDVNLLFNRSKRKISLRANNITEIKI